MYIQDIATYNMSNNFMQSDDDVTRPDSQKLIMNVKHLLKKMSM